MKVVPRLFLSLCSALTGGMVTGFGAEIGSELAHRYWIKSSEWVIGAEPPASANVSAWYVVGFVVVFALVYRSLGD